MKSVYLEAQGSTFFLGYTDQTLELASDYLALDLLDLDMASELILDPSFWTLGLVDDDVEMIANLVSHPKHLIGMLLLKGFALKVSEEGENYLLLNDLRPIRFYLEKGEQVTFGDFYYHERMDPDDSFVTFMKTCAPIGSGEMINREVNEGASLLALGETSWNLMRITSGIAVGRSSTLRYFGYDLSPLQ